MNKISSLLVVLSLGFIMLPMAANAHTEDDPFVVDLIAGQTEDIGEVQVWNDDENLYVTFVVTTGECMIQTHLHVADSLDGIPQTNKGNPIPGQFDYADPHGCVEEYTYTVPLTWDCDTELFIAAHAAMGTLEATTIVSGDGQTIVTQRRSGGDVGFTPVDLPAALAWEPGPNYPNDGPDDSGWEANSLWDQQLTTDLRPTGADWIWESYRVLDPVYGTVLTFERSFDVGWPIGGNLLIACDNGYEVFLNGESLGTDNVYGVWRTSDLKQAFVDVSGWNAVGSYDLFADLLEGTNTLTIDAANEYFDTDDQGNPAPGTASSNPGGLIFALDLEYYADGETAWGAGGEFPGRNWATYFNYTVQCECTVQFPEEGNVYVGYEDWINGDFDYNDFGMNFAVQEIYAGSCGSQDQCLTEVHMTFKAVIFDSGMRHLIHIARPFNGTYSYVVDRGGASYPNVLTLWDGTQGQETAEGNYAGSGDLDVVLFNTAKYTWPQKQINEIVEVHVYLDDPCANPREDLSPPRSYNVGGDDFYDLPGLMANYDPWEIGTLFPPPNGSVFHIEDTQVIANTGSQNTSLWGTIIPVGTEVPMILVVPKTDWIPPWEDTTITGPYDDFTNFYTTGSPADWYLNLDPFAPRPGYGGFSWWP
jgi:hypothetical protein